jgi:RND family efflux transporter MFP subunit
MKKIKIKKKWVIITAIVLLVVGYFSIGSLFKNETDNYITEKVVKGEVLQDVSETGSIKATDSINLSFKSSGRIDSVNVRVGEIVKPGDILAKMETSQLAIQLSDARSALIIAGSQQNKILNGSTVEDIKIVEDAVNSAQQDLDNEYGDALVSLDDAYVKIYNSFTTVNVIQSTYFSTNDQQGIKIQDSKVKIKESMDDIKLYLDKAKGSSSKNDIASALSRAIIDLNKTSDALKVVRDMTDEGAYYTNVSTTDKPTIDTQRGYINTALTSIVSVQQSIDSYKIALQKAESQLAFKKAPARPEDIDLYKAQVSQAQSKIDLLEQQISDNYLRSPINGKITKISNDPGEVVSASSPIISMLSTNPFQIKADIYEQDIVNVKIDNSVKVNLIAFPKDTFLGKIVAIDPAEKIVDNVVYYEVTIDFPDQVEGIRSGMTADIVIETNKKENVLMVPKNAIEKIDGRNLVQIIKGKKMEDREITIGLEGNYYYEVISGLSEGEQVVTGKK